MDKKTFEIKFNRLLNMWINAFHNKDTNTMKIIINKEEKLINKYALSR